MLVTDIIRRKRDGEELTPEEISFFVQGLADDSIPAEQVSALAMAIFFNSMTPQRINNVNNILRLSSGILKISPND